MVAEITVQRVGSRLVPVSQMDEELLRSAFPENEPTEISSKRRRSNKHNRWWHSLLDIVAENHEIYDTQEKLSVFLKIRLGLIEDTVLINAQTGEVQYILKSTKFTKMGQSEFKDFTSKALDIIEHEIWRGEVPRTEIIAQADQRSGVSYRELADDTRAQSRGRSGCRDSRI